MSNAQLIANSPYGYGALSPEQLLKYLTRSVNNVCFAAPEEQYAAELIQQLQTQVAELQKEMETLRHNSPSTHTPAPVIPHPDALHDLHVAQQLASMREEVLILHTKYKEAQDEYKRDGQRLAYCLQEHVYSAGDYIIDQFDREPVLDGCYRNAIDKLIGQ